MIKYSFYLNRGVKYLNKKEIKQIEIDEIIKHQLYSSSDVSGEYETHCNIDCKLSIPIWITVFDKEYKIDRIKMSTRWDELILRYANNEKCFCCFPVAKTFVHKIMKKVEVEQKSGILKGWSFKEDLLDILKDENVSLNCYFY